MCHCICSSINIFFLPDSFLSPDVCVWSAVASRPFEVFVLISGCYNEDILFNLGASSSAMKWVDSV